MDLKNELIEQLKMIGQDLIDRAEELIGDPEAMTDFYIYLRINPLEVPSIDLTKSYIPKGFINRKEVFKCQ